MNGPRIIFSPRFLGLLSIACMLFLFLWPSYTSRIPGLRGPALENFRKNAINNTVVIVPVNSGMMFWAENLLCSLAHTSFNSSKIVFWALDAEAEIQLTANGRAAYHDRTLFSSSKEENLRGDTRAYKKMMKERPKLFIDVLTAGFDILMLDADTVFWQSPLEILPGEGENVDVVFSTDSREFYEDHNAFEDERRRGSFVPPICNGIFWMKSSSKTISLWREMLDVFQSWRSSVPYGLRDFQDDQRGMDVLLNDGRAQVVGPLPGGLKEGTVPRSPQKRPELALNLRLLDQTRVVNGHLLRNRHDRYVEELAKLRASGKERLGAHFNWWTKEISKMDGARDLGMLFADEYGECIKQDAS
jgi:hypothetical protein